MKRFRFLPILLFTFVFNLGYGQTFEIGEDGFYKDGKWYRIISGSLDYAKIAKSQWKDRLLKAKALGLNTIATSVFWNHHETSEGYFDFTSENRNLIQFLSMAKECGLFVILKPGPYIDSSWEMGGLPFWLLQDEQLSLKTNNKFFMAYITRYIQKLFSHLENMQYPNGGPIVLVQLSDWDSSFENQKEFLTTVNSIYKEAGVVVPIFSTDKTFLEQIDGKENNILLGHSFSQNARKNFKTKQASNARHFFAGNFKILSPTYHQQKRFTSFNINRCKRDLRWMLKHGKSFNIDPISAGTQYELTAGALIKENQFYPATIIDGYNAPIHEDGTLTKNYKKIRKLLTAYQNEQDLPVKEVPSEEEKGKGHTIYLKKNATLAEALLLAPIVSLNTKTMEDCGFNYNLIGYKTTLANKKSGVLTINDPHDVAYIYLNGEYLGSLHRNKQKNSFRIPRVRNSHENELIIVVENLGRVTSSEAMSEKKGITQEVRFNDIKILDWEIYPIPMKQDFLETLPYAQNLIYMEPVIHTASFELKKQGDVYFDVLKWTDGIIVVNDHNLGRYQNHSVQNRIYCPKEFLKEGKNNIYILDMGMEHLPSIFIKTSD